MTEAIINFLKWLQEAAPAVFAVAIVSIVVLGAYKLIIIPTWNQAIKTYRDGLNYNNNKKNDV